MSENADSTIDVIECPFTFEELKSSEAFTSNRLEVHADFESRSFCDLNKRGAWVYSKHPTTEILMLCYKVVLPIPIPGRRRPYMLEVCRGRWYPDIVHDIEGEKILLREGTPRPARLITALKKGVVHSDVLGTTDVELGNGQLPLFKGHNVGFERNMWENKMVPEYGFPPILPAQYRCSAAKASAHGLPRALDQACMAMKLEVQKDLEGKALMLKTCKPRVLKRGQPKALYPFTLEEHERLGEYCDIDVEAEEALDYAVLDLTPFELKVWQADQRMNYQGICLDPKALAIANSLIEKTVGKMNASLLDLTDGLVERASQRQRLLKWVRGHGVPMANTEAATVKTFLEKDSTPEDVKKVLKVCVEVNRTSNAKYRAMMDYMDIEDNHAREQFLYCGAGRTGRWSGKGIQPHNFPRGSIKIDMELAWEHIFNHYRDTDVLEMMYGEILELLSSALRGAICASPGKDLIVADYAAIEARVLLWLALDERGLDIFRRGDDIYKDMASGIYNISITEVNSDQRQMGKQAILGLGYGMGAPKFIATVAKYGIEIAKSFAQGVVDTYRDRFSKVKSLWYEYEDGAIEAVKSKGKVVTTGRVQWACRGSFLYCKLPSGRRMAYAYPKLQNTETPWGETKLQLTYMGVDAYTKRWTRIETYGGKLVENVTQATARDMMADAKVKMDDSKDQHPYRILGSVHDEILGEVDEGEGTVEEFENLMADTPDWAKGCPVKAEGWRGKRYRK